MYRLSYVILFLVLYLNSALAQSPHGSELKMNCIACHTTDGWEIPADRWNFQEELEKRISKSTGWELTVADSSFNHFDTDFALEGMHANVDCRACHSTLVFSEATTSCVDCHLDVHSMTVGNDCIRCHTTQDWLVDDIPEIHEENGFLLIGNHGGLSCVDCHISETNLRFDRIGNDCYACHRADFETANNPNHIDAGFSINCIDCHSPEEDGWNTDAVDHSFFPLTLGHDIQDCKACHLTDNFSDASSECIACHQNDFSNALNPDHVTLNFNNDCTVCHTTNPGWMPAEYIDHDAEFFPIYSGAHEGEWNDCIDCHTDPSNFSEFTCIGCHTNPETDDEHVDVVGYIYEDNACLACHPNGDADMAFDHNQTNFPLTGAHIGIECLECHSDGFEGTSTNCVDCHTTDFEGSINPNHSALNLPSDCINCHTTDPEWMPATFDIHDDFYPLEGAHAAIANDCVACHNGDYNNTPNTCVGCHLDDFTNTADPDHEAANFSTDCVQCHSQDAWEPSNFDHDVQYFPIYSGWHEGEWNDCIDCHTNPSNFQEFQCINCHINPKTDEEHEGVAGYIYEDNACLACHPTGEADMAFNHDETAFPLTGAHIGVDCIECHSEGYEGTSTNCVDCHTVDFEGSINPNHTVLNLSTDCISCHTTDPDWMPATFEVHDDFYPLEGAHAMIANDCVACHNGDYNNTPNTCIGCHLEEFNNTVEPNHVDANFSTDCTQCHTLDAWEPSTFNHDEFYVLEGAHANIAQECLQCHANGYENTPNTCIGCHLEDFNSTVDPDHAAANFSTDCIQCHTQDEWEPSTFDHDAQFFPIYSGAHEGEWSDCIDCHTNPNNYQEFQCTNCHINPETDEEHLGVAGYIYEDNACLACHPTGDADMAFNHDDTAFPLTGAHIGVECLDCHSAGFEGASTNCIDCHTMDFEGSINPSHTELNLSTDCINCHTTDPEWMPATFDIHDDFYPLEGAHAMISNDCVACHNGDYNNTPNTCIGCHLEEFNNTSSPDHQAANFSNDCLECHTQDAWEPSTFDHNSFYELVGAHADIAQECLQCHANGYENTPNTCVGCHQMDYDQTIDPNHTDAQFGTDCSSCHNQDAWEPADFDHDGQYFPIYSGSHDGEWSQCIDCHTDPSNYSLFACINCHINPETDEEHTGVGGYIYEDNACLACHPTGEADEGINHDDTNFPLTGAHIMTDCIDCHANGYQGTPTDCNSCHSEDFNGSINPNHTALGISNDCVSCHTTEPGWSPATFDVHDDYYELTGAHIPIAAECATCHNGDYNNTPTDCVGCHQMDYDGSLNPNHTTLNLATDCISCHTTEPDWMPASFDVHDDYYPLEGAHAAIANDCATCHNGDYNNTPNTCIGCHQIDYNSTTNPDHNAAMFPNDCLECHTQDAWTPSTFDHDGMYFPIYSGSHEGEWGVCLDCHTNPNNFAVFTCIACHINPETDEEHEGVGGYIYEDNACLACHPTGESDEGINHDETGFPLTGAHIMTDCIDCHADGYQGTPTDCNGCHSEDFNNAANPNHINLGISNDCVSCHTTELGWAPATFDIHDDFYALTGAHLPISNDCIACHNGDYINTPNDCAGCHQMDFDESINPNHQSLNISTDCVSCHTTDPGWSPATFEIHDDYYPLTGAHLPIANDCIACHNGDYNNTPNDCVGCHQSDYDISVNPSHQQLNLSTDCASCHTTNPDWMPATFDVHDDYYPLNGAHAAIANDCVACHNGDYINTPNTCIACHQMDYDNTTNPDHQVAMLSTECLDCHTESAWTPSTFDHSSFWPLNGAHSLIANDCLQCHASGYENTPNTCIACHQTEYDNTTNPNHGAAMFSTDCLECHTEDAWTPSTFDHNSFWPLNGAHASIANDCLQCHANGYENTPNTCIACHQTDYDNATNPDHAAAMFSTDCLDCHTEDAWTPSTFDHDNQYFPIYSGKHEGEWTLCIDCHINSSDFSIFSCIDCHEHDDPAQVADDHDGVSGYIYESNACFACHPNGED